MAEGFAARHIGPSPAEMQHMLDALGVASLEELVDRAVPPAIRDPAPLDEPPAAAEAMAMLHRLNEKAGDTFFVDAGCHPQTIDVVRTRAEPVGIEVVVGDIADDVPSDGVFGVLLQYPNTRGAIWDDRE